jgi:hypothetical protein
MALSTTPMPMTAPSDVMPVPVAEDVFRHEKDDPREGELVGLFLALDLAMNEIPFVTPRHEHLLNYPLLESPRETVHRLREMHGVPGFAPIQILPRLWYIDSWPASGYRSPGFAGAEASKLWFVLRRDPHYRHQYPSVFIAVINVPALPQGLIIDYEILRPYYDGDADRGHTRRVN